MEIACPAPAAVATAHVKVPMGPAPWTAMIVPIRLGFYSMGTPEHRISAGVPFIEYRYPSLDLNGAQPKRIATNTPAIVRKMKTKLSCATT